MTDDSQPPAPELRIGMALTPRRRTHPLWGTLWVLRYFNSFGDSICERYSRDEGRVRVALPLDDWMPG